MPIAGNCKVLNVTSFIVLFLAAVTAVGVFAGPSTSSSPSETGSHRVIHTSFLLPGLDPDLAQQVSTGTPEATGTPVGVTPQISDTELMEICADSQTELMFVSGMPGDIYIANADGTGQRPLTINTTPDNNPSWSPDGRRIAFASQSVGNSQIALMDADGSNVRLLTRGAASFQPSWSPDGTRIVYVRYIQNQGDLWIMNADGSNQRPLTSNSADEQWPSWSPTGREIAYVVNTASNSAIHIISASGMESRPLTDGDGLNSLAQWSPDGTSIVFTSNRSGTAQIHIMNSDGSNVRNISNNDAIEAPGDWSPDGQYIAFFSNRSGGNPDQFDIYVMSADGQRVRQLTNSAEHDENPTWRPCQGAETTRPTAAPLTTGCTISSSTNVNMRIGPGTEFGIADTLALGSEASVIGRRLGSDGIIWWQVEDRLWVRSDVVDESGACANVPFAAP